MKKKILLCYANYTGQKHDFIEKYTTRNFSEYCNLNNIEFLFVRDKSKFNIDRHPTWMSWQIISNLIDSNYINNGDLISSIDADACIVKKDKLLFTNKSFGYAIDSCNTHCMGFYSLKINEWTKNLVKNVLDEERYQRLKEESMWKMWNDQASVYTIFGIQRHSWIPFNLLKDNGWHSDKSNDTIYTIDELHEHVEIMPTEYNVTHVTGEGFNEYFINPTQKKDIIIRHFAGSPNWLQEYFKND